MIVMWFLCVSLRKPGYAKQQNPGIKKDEMPQKEDS